MWRLPRSAARLNQVAAPRWLRRPYQGERRRESHATRARPESEREERGDETATAGAQVRFKNASLTALFGNVML